MGTSSNASCPRIDNRLAARHNCLMELLGESQDAPSLASKPASSMYSALVRGELSGTDALSASQQMLQMLMESMATAVFWKDLESSYLGCNRVFARFAGVEPEVLVGMSDRDMPWADHHDFPAAWFTDWDRKVIETGKPHLGIIEQLRSASGEYRWLRTNKVPLRDLDGEIFGILGTFEDVTEHRRAEDELQRTMSELDDRVRRRTQELLQSNQSLRREVEDRVRLQAEERQQRAYAEALRDTAAAMAKSLDVAGVTAETVVGVQRLVSNDLTALVLLEDSGPTLAGHQVGFGYDEADMTSPLTELSIYPLLVGEGNVTVLDRPERSFGPAGSVVAVPLRTVDRVIGFLVVESATPGFFTSAHAERLGAVADLAGASISNARLVARVSEIATTEERQRVARELHDAVNQSLWAAALTAESLVADLADQAQLKDRASRLGALTRGALAEMRTLLLELQPSGLTDIPLAELIAHLLGAVEARRTFDVSVDLQSVSLPGEIHLTFYRIAQEAISNSVRHSNATSLDIRLTQQPQPALVVEDNGSGFDPDLSSPGHLGIQNMRERANAAGIDFSLETAVGKGTTVRIRYSP